MNSKYRWKNGARPNRDQAVKQDHLLDESQFESVGDQELAENSVRKQLGVPARTLGDDPVLSSKEDLTGLEPS
ncbi:MAG: hypothetical protein SFW36_22225 [Leptolyngbyaceae cyanobacterium bins.59]|nr:hypothetical protein [Leptolyngbyaceae cyanobacterium bins.59]